MARNPGPWWDCSCAATIAQLLCGRLGGAGGRPAHHQPAEALDPKPYNLKPLHTKTRRSTLNPKQVLIAHSAWWHRQTPNTSPHSRSALLAAFVRSPLPPPPSFAPPRPYAVAPPAVSMCTWAHACACVRAERCMFPLFSLPLTFSRAHTTHTLPVATSPFPLSLSPPPPLLCLPLLSLPPSHLVLFSLSPPSSSSLAPYQPPAGRAGS